jgi:hypothetical protein
MGDVQVAPPPAIEFEEVATSVEERFSRAYDASSVADAKVESQMHYQQVSLRQVAGLEAAGAGDVDWQGQTGHRDRRPAQHHDPQARFAQAARLDGDGKCSIACPPSASSRFRDRNERGRQLRRL